MEVPRRKVLWVLGAGALAGCSSGEPSAAQSPDPTSDPTDEPSGSDDDSGSTAPSGSCASLFGDTMGPYDTSGRGMVATFSYPMGGEILFEQSNDGDHLTSVGYGRGEMSPLHDLTVSERGPLGSTGDATEAYSFDDDYESGTVTTYGGQERPTAIRRTEDESVTYVFRVEEDDGFYEFSVKTAVGEGDPCPEPYESVTRQIAESFEPVA
jgi:hypothetical protein